VLVDRASLLRQKRRSSSRCARFRTSAHSSARLTLGISRARSGS